MDINAIFKTIFHILHILQRPSWGDGITPWGLWAVIKCRFSLLQTRRVLVRCKVCVCVCVCSRWYV